MILNVPAGCYLIQSFLRAGKNPDDSDACVYEDYDPCRIWNGSAMVYISEKAAKMLINKVIQTKNMGVIEYYDDGETIILTHTPTDGESTITRTPN